MLVRLLIDGFINQKNIFASYIIEIFEILNFGINVINQYAAVRIPCSVLFSMIFIKSFVGLSMDGFILGMSVKKILALTNR